MRGLAVPVRGVAGWERSGGAERQVEAGRDHDRCSEGCLNVAGACSVATAGCSRSRWTTAAGSARRQRPRWTRRCGSGSCSGRRSTRCGTSVPTIATTSTADDSSGKILRALGERAVRGRVASPGPAAAVGVVRVSVAGTGGSVGARLCGVRRRRPVAGLWHAGCRRRRRPGRGGSGPPAGRGARDASTRLMPEQNLGVPACPRRESGHLWRFDRERSTRDCQADVCQACGLVRLTRIGRGRGCATWERMTATHERSPEPPRRTNRGSLHDG